VGIMVVANVQYTPATLYIRVIAIFISDWTSGKVTRKIAGVFVCLFVIAIWNEHYFELLENEIMNLVCPSLIEVTMVNQCFMMFWCVLTISFRNQIIYIEWTL